MFGFIIKTIAVISTVGGAVWVIDYYDKYKGEVTISPAPNSLNYFKTGDQKIKFTVSNDRDDSLNYTFKVSTDLGSIKDPQTGRQFDKNEYVSRTLRLSANGTPGDTIDHEITLFGNRSQPNLMGEGNIEQILSYVDDHKYYFLVQVINEDNGITVYKSKCEYDFYSFPGKDDHFGLTSQDQSKGFIHSITNMFKEKCNA